MLLQGLQVFHGSKLQVPRVEALRSPPGREVRQSRVTLADAACRLVRVVVETVGDDTKIVTVYRTSKLAKYWRA